MQIIESSRWGVRSARLTFRHPVTDQAVTLFPMLHVAEASFYERVFREANAYEAVLVEGVDSPITKRITRSYRWIGERMGLVVQPRHPPTEGATIVHADLSGEAFETLWSSIPRWQRWLIALVAPLLGLHRRWFGTREMIADRAGMDDAMSRDELLEWNSETALLHRVLLDARDERLLEVLGEQLAIRQSIAVVYGAAHMRAVIRELGQRRGFVPSGGEWMLVFAL